MVYGQFSMVMEPVSCVSAAQWALCVQRIISITQLINDGFRHKTTVMINDGQSERESERECERELQNEQQSVALDSTLAIGYARQSDHLLTDGSW